MRIVMLIVILFEMSYSYKLNDFIYIDSKSIKSLVVKSIEGGNVLEVNYLKFDTNGNVVLNVLNGDTIINIWNNNLLMKTRRGEEVVKYHYEDSLLIKKEFFVQNKLVKVEMFKYKDSKLDSIVTLDRGKKEVTVYNYKDNCVRENRYVNNKLKNYLKKRYKSNNLIEEDIVYYTKKGKIKNYTKYKYRGGKLVSIIENSLHNKSKIVAEYKGEYVENIKFYNNGILKDNKRVLYKNGFPIEIKSERFIQKIIYEWRK